MAKIDSVGRMRLPPDSGIRTQAHSRREHAASGPVKQAMTEWFQAIQGTRRESADDALARSIRSVLTDAATRGETLPRALPLQVLATLPVDKPGTHRYQVQLGQSLLTLTSRAPLEPGQTLMVTPGNDGPRVINPNTGEQQRLIQVLTQQQQLNWLPAPQPRTSLAALVPWLNTAPPMPDGTSAAAGRLPETTATPANQPGVSGQTAGAGALGGPASTSASWLVVALQQVIGQWQQAMPQSAGANTTMPAFQGPVTASTLATGGDHSNTGTTAATPATAPTASGTPTAPGTASGSAAVDGNGQRIQQSDHWIPQLVRTAIQEYGKATPKTVRQVWQSWQQAASSQARAMPMPDLSQASLRPTATGLSTLPPAPHMPSAPSVPPSTSNFTIPPAGSAQTTSTPVAPSPEVPMPTRAPTLADLVPVLRTANSPETVNRSLADNHQSSRIPPVPTDIWRVAAEQLIDLRLQQLGQGPQHSLQEALQRRAEQLMRQTTTTYSPEQLKQQFQRGAASGQTTAGGQNAEQQALLQVRQLLDQVGQQQQVRALQLPIPENPNETPRQMQGIPVLADQQVVWFDLERQPPAEQEAESSTATREWVLDLHFQLPPMAPVCARLRWQNDRGRVEFLTDDTPTLRALHSHLTPFQERLQQLHMPIEDVQVRHGLPKRQHGRDGQGTDNSPDHRIDVRT